MWLLSLHGQRLMLFSEDWNGWIDAGVFLKACMNLSGLWHMFGRMHHHAVCVGPPPHRGSMSTMFAPLCERWSFCHDGLTRWRLLCGQHCRSSKASRRLHCWRHGKLKIHRLLTKEILWRNHFQDRLAPAFSESFLKAKYPALEDARCSTRISSYSAQYWWHHYSLPMLEAQKVGRFFGFFPFVWRAFLRRQACWV